MEESLQTRLYSQLEDAPWRHAYAFINSEGRFSWLTLEDVYNRAAGFSASLTDLGLRRGDVCVLVLPSSEFCATTLIATLLLGAVPLLVAPPIVQGRGLFSNLKQILGHVIRKTKPRMVIASETMSEMRQELGRFEKTTRFIFGEDSLDTNNPVKMSLISPAKTSNAALQLTSGTTGSPRVCMWGQEQVLAALDGMALAMQLDKDDVCLNWTPLYHDMGLVNNFLLCLTKGVPLAMLSPLDFARKPALWLRGLFNTGSTMTWSPNFGFAITAERVREEEVTGVRLDRVRKFWNAAERIHLETIRAFYERFASLGVCLESLKTNYGCAENVGGATFSNPNGMFVVEQIDQLVLQKKRIACPVTQPEDGRQIVSVVGAGRPVPGIKIKILSRQGRILPDGYVGEVVLDTPSRMLGYLGEAGTTRRVLSGNLLRTGDLGYMRGNEFFWVGRRRERITVRGKKLDSSDFERVLLKISDLRHGCFTVFGVEDTQLGTERIVVLAEVQDSVSRSHRDILSDIRSQVYLQLGMTLSDVLLLPKGTLTKTSSGKRRHRYFRQLYLDGNLESLRISKAA